MALFVEPHELLDRIRMGFATSNRIVSIVVRSNSVYCSLTKLANNLFAVWFSSWCSVYRKTASCFGGTNYGLSPIPKPSSQTLAVTATIMLVVLISF